MDQNKCVVNQEENAGVWLPVIDATRVRLQYPVIELRKGSYLMDFSPESFRLLTFAEKRQRSVLTFLYTWTIQLSFTTLHVDSGRVVTSPDTQPATETVYEDRQIIYAVWQSLIVSWPKQRRFSNYLSVTYDILKGLNSGVRRQSIYNY